jgi:putative membrane protein
MRPSAVVHEHGAIAQGLPALCVTLALVAAGAIYAVSVLRHLPSRRWPTDRIGVWLCGLAALWGALISPIAARETLFDRVLVHLLLGLVAPLLLVLAAPVALALRGLEPVPARRLAAALGSLPVRLLLHPVVAAVLAAGGLWLVYSTALYSLARPATPLAVLVDAGLFLGGCLFAAAMVGFATAHHGPRLRLAVLACVLVTHLFLAWRVAVHPPAAVGAAESAWDALLLAVIAATVDIVMIVTLARRATSARAAALRGEVQAVGGDHEREPGEPEHPRGQDIGEPVVSEVHAAEPDREREQRTGHDGDDSGPLLLLPQQQHVDDRARDHRGVEGVAARERR